jgi:hypothetical protein
LKYVFAACSGMVLGQGAFGRVIKADAIGIQKHEDVTVVAIKMARGRSKVIILKEVKSIESKRDQGSLAQMK